MRHVQRPAWLQHAIDASRKYQQQTKELKRQAETAQATELERKSLPSTKILATPQDNLGDAAI